MLEFIIGFILGGAICWKISDWLNVGTLVTILQELNITEADLARIQSPASDSGAVPEVAIKIEQHGLEFYAYKELDDTFLGQAATADALFQIVLSKMPQGTTVVYDHSKLGNEFNPSSK